MKLFSFFSRRRVAVKVALMLARLDAAQLEEESDIEMARRTR